MANDERTRGQLNPYTVLALEQVVGPCLDVGAVGPVVVGVDPVPQFPRGVYVALDTQGRCAYVGKVCSELDSGRLRTRLNSHLREVAKRENFDCIYFFPVKSGVSNREIERIEGWVSRHLRPRLGKRAPDVRR